MLHTLKTILHSGLVRDSDMIFLQHEPFCSYSWLVACLPNCFSLNSRPTIFFLNPAPLPIK
jgi:hypothetical protein